MSDPVTAQALLVTGQARQRQLGLSYAQGLGRKWLRWSVAFWVFCGGFVLFEPSPYEAAFLLVIPLAYFGGMHLHRGTLALFCLTLCFAPFALIAGFQTNFLTADKALIYIAVTIYLWLTAYVVANFIADDPVKHMRVVIYSYTAVACLVALIGTLAYLGLLPGGDLFLRYGRAKALFKDPNVFGPFLILPAIFALQRILLSHGKAALVPAGIYVLLFIGVFVSFSRGAWGHLLASSLIAFALIFFGEARIREKMRMVQLMAIGSAALVVMLAALLSIDSVRELFEIRFSVAQSYDTGSSGRFGRQSYAFDLALTHPWGMGPGEFAYATRIAEEPHNVYVNVFLSYGWMGGFAFVAFVGATIWRGVSRVLLPSPHRLLLIPLVSTFVPLMVESAIIDSDHWRHLYLIAGLIWGVTANYKTSRKLSREGLI